MDTNGQILRKMSDEELAAFLYGVEQQMCRMFRDILGLQESFIFGARPEELLIWLKKTPDFKFPTQQKRSE